ncbi:hypothetical protein DFJ73DRAFT_759883 [Zopfochytrium polystomum]|nr:hypothetical protein DFJ73DRAFT_759883 [Zopfochytrium polystomum]
MCFCQTRQSINWKRIIQRSGQNSDNYLSKAKHSVQVPKAEESTSASEVPDSVAFYSWITELSWPDLLSIYGMAGEVIKHLDCSETFNQQENGRANAAVSAVQVQITNWKQMSLFNNTQ